VGFGALVRLNLAKHFADQAVPTGGVTGSALVVDGLLRRKMARSRAMAAFVVQTVGNSAALILAEVIALALLASLGAVPTWLWLAAAAFIAVSVAVPVAVVLLALGRPLPLPKLLRKRKAVRSLQQAMSTADSGLIGEPRLLFAALAPNLVVTLVDAAVLWLLLAAIGSRVDPEQAYVAQAVVLLARNAAFLPSAFGTFDMTSVGVLSLLGVGVASAIAATMLFRVVNLWLPIVPGGWAAHRELARPA
jgi:uncharacterized membrane protein YbhN (UPF0104 family)